MQQFIHVLGELEAAGQKTETHGRIHIQYFFPLLLWHFEELCMKLVFVVFKKWHQIIYRAMLHQPNTECHFLRDAMCCLGGNSKE